LENAREHVVRVAAQMKDQQRLADSEKHRLRSEIEKLKAVYAKEERELALIRKDIERERREIGMERKGLARRHRAAPKCPGA
jgi:hypothetical protein